MAASPGAVAEEVEGEAIARLRLVPAPEDLVAGPEADGRLGLAERRPEAAVDLERPLEAAAGRRVVAAPALEGREVREGGRDPPEVARALGLLEALPLHRLALLPAPGPGEDGGEGRESAPDEVAPSRSAGPPRRRPRGAPRPPRGRRAGRRPSRACRGGASGGRRAARGRPGRGPPRPSPRRRRGRPARGGRGRRRRGGAPAPRSSRPCRAPPPRGRRGRAPPPRRRGAAGSSRS